MYGDALRNNHGNVGAPDSKKSLEMYEECIASVVKVLREGRKGGAKDFYITGDFNVELGLMSTDENDNEVLTKLYGPLAYDTEPGGFKKIMWYGIMKEFDCKVSSSRSVCGKVRAEAFTHRHLGKDRKEELLQLDYVIGPMGRNEEVYIHIAGRLWATWDHYPILARIEEEPHVKDFQKRNKKWTGWKPTTEEQLLLFKRGVMKKHGRRSLDCTEEY